MQKKVGIVIVAGICGVLCGILIGWLLFGRGEQKTDIADAEQEEIKTGDEGLFPDLKTGDRILVVHDNDVMESFPEQMNVYMYCRIGQGGKNSLVEEAINALKELGWNIEEME